MKQDELRIGSREVRVIHREWNDRLFSSFGGKIGTHREPLTTAEAAELFSEQLLQETRAALNSLGFLVFEVKDFDPEQAPFLTWHRIINDRKELPNVNMVPHTDFDEVALFSSRRKCPTSISGRTGVAEAVLSSLSFAEQFPPSALLCAGEFRYQLQQVIAQSSEYAEHDPLIDALVPMHYELSRILAFEPEVVWPFLQALYQRLVRRSHKHFWRGDQMLLISSQAFHYREIPSLSLLTESTPIWRAHLSQD